MSGHPPTAQSETPEAAAAPAGAHGHAEGGADAGTAGGEPGNGHGKGGKVGALIHAVKGGARGIVTGFLTIVQGLWSSDGPTRRMSFLFFLSLFLGVTIASWGLKRYQIHLAEQRVQLSEAEKVAWHAQEVLKQQQDDTRILNSQILIGTFQVELTPAPGEKKIRGMRYVADLDVVVVCDDKPTREHIQENLLAARGQVSSAIVPMQRADMLTREGKNHLKRVIQLKLNAWLPFGKVEEVHFTRLILN